MQRAIPQWLYRRYPRSPWLTIYLPVRWRLCPFEFVEKLVPAEGTILDLGCGYGLLANLMAVRSPRRQVVGVDMDDSRASVAKEAARGLNNVRFHCEDVTKLELEPCDAIVMSDFLHHLPYPVQEELLGECFRRLKPGGELIIQDNDRAPRLKLAYAKLFHRIFYANGQFCTRSVAEWRELLRRVGFDSVEVIPAHVGLPDPDVILVCRRPEAPDGAGGPEAER